jgi:uncharacterized membrane protein SpoIIM required for sporulation
MAMLLVGESMIMFWARYEILWWAIFGQGIIAWLLVRTGIAHFNREDLLGRELDTLNLRWAWEVFRKGFIGETSPDQSWWRLNVWNSLINLRWPILLALIVSVGAGFIGAAQAEIFKIPADILNWENLENGLVTGIEEVGPIRFFSVEGIGQIFLHNLRAISLASLLGIFSFGVLGILVLVLPFSIIGYFAAIAGQTGLAASTFLVGFVLPHGVVEIPAIILTGSLIIRLGLTLVTPDDEQSIGEAWVRSLAEWARMVLCVIMPLLLIAAILEVYLTPTVAINIFSG